MLTVDLYGDVPPYRQIASYFRERIRSGELAPGTRLPSEAELMDTTGVARMTVRRALSELQDEGLVEARHGRGVFVRSLPSVVRVGASRFSREQRESTTGAFAAEVQRMGLKPRQVLREVATVSPPPEIAKRLDLRGRAKVVVRRRLMLADDVPMQIADSYFPAALVRGSAIERDSTGKGGSYSRLAELGHKPVRGVEELLARMPSPEERKALALAKGTPVVALTRTAYDESGQPVEVFVSVAAGDKHVFVYEVPLD